MIPEVGDIVFVMHTKNWISKLFAGVMKSKWSHSAIVYGKLNGELVLLETNDYCVNVNYLRRYIEDKDCRVQIFRRPKPLDMREKSTVMKQGRPLIGMLYGYLQLPVLALRRLFSLKLRNFSRQGLVCCHVIGYAYEGIESPLKDIDPESFDTQELYELIVSNGWAMLYEKEV
jgi:hypothetical protein